MPYLRIVDSSSGIDPTEPFPFDPADPNASWNQPPVDYDTRPNLFASLTERERKALDGYREPVLDRVASALGSERFLFFYFGIIAGCFLTVGFAFLWGVL